jgi:glycosyltransferase involved in cell wall biosynthesis
MPPIRMISHSYADETNTNAQNLAVREIARRLDPARFTITLFHRDPPDPRLATRPNVRLRRLFSHGKAATILATTLLGSYDVNFYVRNEWVDAAYLRARSVLAPRQIAVYHVLSSLDAIPDQTVLSGVVQAIRRSQMVVSNSRYVARSVASMLGVSTPVIRDIVDLDRFSPDPERVRHTGPVRFLFAGSLQEWKRPGLVLDAAEAVPDCEFRIVGSGPLRDELEARSARLHNVRMDPAMPQTMLADVMRRSDVFLFPSGPYEGAPQVVAQAAASGLPVVAFDAYDTEAVQHGRTGYLVRSEREMTASVRSLADHAGLRAGFGAAGRELVQRRFDPASIVPLWEDGLRRALRDARTGVGAAPTR